jgi:cysteine desulfurase
MKRIYLDYAATTPVDPKILEIMKPYFLSRFGNASSLHKFGQEAKRALEDSRESIARLINAEPEEIIFTSGGTESDNMAIEEIVYPNMVKGKHVITSKIEHPAILETCEFIESDGFNVTYINVDKTGMVNPDDVKKAINDKTTLVTVMHANNEIGTIEPIEEIGKTCRKEGVVFHTDAVQTFGKIPIDVKKMNIDLLTGSAHKIYGPKGVGFLYVRKGIGITPLIHGGGQEFGKRSGTENIAGIVGFGAAAEIARKEMKKESARELKLRDYLIKNVLKIENSHLNGHPVKRLPNNANFWFDFIEGESLITHLDFYGIAASTGSACSSKSLEPSHVLRAIGLKHEQAHGSLRLTLGKYTKRSDIDYVLSVLPKVVKRLREISPLR